MRWLLGARVLERDDFAWLGPIEKVCNACAFTILMVVSKLMLILMIVGNWFTRVEDALKDLLRSD